MACGLDATAALAQLRTEASHLEFRQLALIDRLGRTAAFSGERTLGLHHVAEAADVVAAGNLLADRSVPARMVDRFTALPTTDLGGRLLAAMQAGLQAGGEAGPVRSAGLLLVREVVWPVADLRIDWDDIDPIAALARLWERWRPEMEAYVTRALDPTDAPSYGVPGNP